MHPELEDYLLECMAQKERKQMEKLSPQVEHALLTIPLASAAGLTRYEKLVSAHGTLAEFTTAVKNAIGEISVAEADAAILKYRQELLAALDADMADHDKEKQTTEPLTADQHRLRNFEKEVHASLDAMGAPQFLGMEYRASFRLLWIAQQREWKPMATAPRDGTEIILVVEKRAGIPHQQLVGHWMPGGHCIEDHPPISEGWYFWNGSMFDKASKPLAWMPSPEFKPKEKKNDEAKTL